MAVVIAVLAVVLELLLNGGRPGEGVREPCTQAAAALARRAGGGYHGHDEYGGYCDVTAECQILIAGRAAAAMAGGVQATDAAYQALVVLSGASASPNSDGYAAALVFLACLTGGQPAPVGHSPGAAAPD
ncbi:hypothetical protein, partial [Saccharothrix sp. ST-888]|uniref:hypothetical protein n=1 Tax=Saccharothrix sp. ST-888 TaxID=1427391 RepID=UPI0018CCA002